MAAAMTHRPSLMTTTTTTKIAFKASDFQRKSEGRRSRVSSFWLVGSDGDTESAHLNPLRQFHGWEMIEHLPSPCDEETKGLSNWMNQNNEPCSGGKKGILFVFV
mmetsp:Transcript_7053/g.19755  ORF Transcript_7053/g.19755 Transcript_7053/m.19755 type:complete len:105 (+) Transcript_7053:1443-1757(+)